MNKSVKEEHFAKEEFEKLLSCCPANEENFAHLVRMVRRNVVIPFIGAGVAANFGYPGWEKFLRKQAQLHGLDEVEKALANREYESAASILKDRLGGDTLEHIMLQVFGDHVYKQTDWGHELDIIPQIFPNLMITTNVDEVMEMLYARVNGEYIEKLTPKMLKDSRVIYKRIACGEPTLIKLHGDIATREFVLTEEEYDATYGKTVLDTRLPLPAFLKEVLLSRIILFLGCSLEEDRTLSIIEQAQIDGSMSFALLPLPSDTENKEHPWKPYLDNDKFRERERFLNIHNIIPIWYPYRKFEFLKLFLKELAYQASPDFRLSVTDARGKLDTLLREGKGLVNQKKIQQAFGKYSEAEELLKNGSGMFPEETRIAKFWDIKHYYDASGHTYERKEILKELLDLTEQSSHYYSNEMAMAYHDFAYTFEKYWYYKLMLKALIRSENILTEILKGNPQIPSDSEGIVSERLKLAKDNLTRVCISMGYAWLKNGNKGMAKEYYEKAERLAKEYKDQMCLATQAFVSNGLNRYYYFLRGDVEKALKCLDIALNMRRNLADDYIIPQHIINTHSNKIRIYLREKDVKKAREEYESCRQEPDIDNRLNIFPEARSRILMDYGDILNAEGKYEQAYEEYKHALQNRKYLHFVDDFNAAELYLKMADSLQEISSQREAALEYYIEAYLILKKMLDKDHPEVLSVREKAYSLGEQLSHTTNELKQRLDVQQGFLDFRSDERMTGREDELIQYLGL